MNEVWLDKGRAKYDISVVEAQNYLEETNNKNHKRLAPRLASVINGKERPVMTPEEKINFISLYLESQRHLDYLREVLHTSLPNNDQMLRLISILLNKPRFLDFIPVLKTDEKRESQLLFMFMVAEELNFQIPFESFI